MFDKPRFEKEYQGILYFHLKHVKKDLGFANLDLATQTASNQQFLVTLRGWTLPEFYQQVLVQELDSFGKRLEFTVRSFPGLAALLYRLTGKHTPLRIARLQQFQQDLSCIDFERDVVQVIRDFAAQPLLRHQTATAPQVSESC